MGDAADDMYEHAMREAEKVLCVKHQHYYHPQWGCELCEDGFPAYRDLKSKTKSSPKGKKIDWDGDVDDAEEAA